MGDPQKAVAKGDWQGEFSNYDEWANLGPQPPYRSATFTDAQGRRCVTQHDDVVSLSMILLGRGTTGPFQ